MQKQKKKKKRETKEQIKTQNWEIFTIFEKDTHVCDYCIHERPTVCLMITGQSRALKDL